VEVLKTLRVGGERPARKKRISFFDANFFAGKEKRNSLRCVQKEEGKKIEFLLPTSTKEGGRLFPGVPGKKENGSNIAPLTEKEKKKKLLPFISNGTGKRADRPPDFTRLRKGKRGELLPAGRKGRGKIQEA